LPDLAEVNLGAMERTENDIQNVESQMQALRRERVFLMAQLQQASSAAPETASLRQLEEEYRRKSISYDESHPDMISLRRQIDQLRSGGSVAGMSLQAQLQTQRSILSEARQRYSDDHPDVKRIKRNIESLEARIASGETADRTLSSDSPIAVQLRTQLNATDSQLAALQARSLELRTRLTELETHLSAAPEVEREFQDVTRDLAGARAKYDELLKRQMDAEVNEAAIAGGTVDEFRVAEKPVLAREPAKPARLAIFLVAFVLAASVAFAAVVAAQFFDQTVRGVRDIRDILNVTPLAAVPMIETASTMHLRRRQAMIFVARTALGIAVVYYVTTQFLF
jgi:succinoglycan biosynthesis transport protein ExoP